MTRHKHLMTKNNIWVLQTRTFKHGIYFIHICGQETNVKNNCGQETNVKNNSIIPLPLKNILDFYMYYVFFIYIIVISLDIRKTNCVEIAWNNKSIKNKKEVPPPFGKTWQHVIC